LEGKGRCQNIVCPAHRWTYDLDGGLLGAPEFPTNPPLPLARRPLQNWHGLLFSGERNVTADLADFRLAHEYDFHGYVHDHTQIDECPFNWKTFLDIYLELYHVEFFHPGLKHFVDSGNYEWGFGERWSYQILGLKDQLRQQHSAKYERYRDLLLAHSGGELPKYGTLWSIYYPNVMLEWYPFALVVSTLVPRTPEHTTNVVEFYYPEEVALFERELVEAHQAAYAESAAEDLRLCTLLQRGRMALYRNGAEDRGPYHSPHEDGMVHFHDFVRRELGF
jgi:phenylpropionate dioxygenase-like ring-hydroxylating dioxygenase large terminal subunit